MWRTVFITAGEKVSLKDNFLAVETEQENLIPIEDIYAVVAESAQTLITVKAINALTQAGAHIVLCDDKHLPCSLTLPLNNHYRAFAVLKKQLAIPDALKDALWQTVIKAKILNQQKVLAYAHRSENVRERMRGFADEVAAGDPTNREGLAAKMFFRELYGCDFIRMADDSINSALNYGYAILRSAVSKSLTAYGYNCAFGIHHIGEYNPYNLSDDFMEPFRPLVDCWTDLNHNDLMGELTRSNKTGLIGLLNATVRSGGKRVKTRNAIDLMIKSFTTCLNDGVADALVLPEVLPLENEL